MAGTSQEIVVEDDGAHIRGTWTTVSPSRGVVIFAHGSGSSRSSPRNVRVATVLQRAGYSTLLLDLLTEQESIVDERTARPRFDVPLLARRVVAAIDMLRRASATSGAPVALFGASTGAAAALVAASARPLAVAAVVSRGGRPDLAGDALPLVRAPTLLIVGGNDPDVLALNESALQRLRVPRELAVVPGATHLFSEPGALDHVAGLARTWLDRFIPWQDVDVVTEAP
jgi:putative phosphoribosyl transferase